MILVFPVLPKLPGRKSRLEKSVPFHHQTTVLWPGHSGDQLQMLTQIQMIIEVVLSFFLLLGIIYSFYLGRVLSNLRRDRASLLALVEKLESSVRSAEDGVEKLRVAGEVSGRPLSRMIEQAKITNSELAEMAGKADGSADRLHVLVTQMLAQEKQLKELISEAEEVRTDLLRQSESITSQIAAQSAATASSQALPEQEIQSHIDGPMAGHDTAEDELTTPHVKLDSPRKESMFADTINVPAPASVTRTRPYMRALEKNFLSDPAGLVTVWSRSTEMMVSRLKKSEK